jgi:hypothetical protein
VQIIGQPLPTVETLQALCAAQDDDALARIFNVDLLHAARRAAICFIKAVPAPTEADRQNGRNWLRAEGLIEPPMEVENVR